MMYCHLKLYGHSWCEAISKKAEQSPWCVYLHQVCREHPCVWFPCITLPSLMILGIFAWEKQVPGCIGCWQANSLESISHQALCQTINGLAAVVFLRVEGAWWILELLAKSLWESNLLQSMYAWCKRQWSFIVYSLPWLVLPRFWGTACSISD